VEHLVITGKQRPHAVEGKLDIEEGLNGSEWPRVVTVVGTF